MTAHREPPLSGKRAAGAACSAAGVLVWVFAYLQMRLSTKRLYRDCI